MVAHIRNHFFHYVNFTYFLLFPTMIGIKMVDYFAFSPSYIFLFHRTFLSVLHKFIRLLLLIFFRFYSCLIIPVCIAFCIFIFINFTFDWYFYFCLVTFYSI